MTQQSAEVLYRLLCLVRIESNQGIDVVQGVQQKVRIDLVVQVFQFGFNPFQFGLLPAQFSFVPFFTHTDGGGQCCNQSEQNEIAQTKQQEAPESHTVFGRRGSTVKIGIDQLKPQMGEEQHTDAERHIGEDVGFISFIEQQLGNKPYIIEVEHHGHGQRRPHHTKHFLLAGAFVGPSDQHRWQTKQEHPCQEMDEQFL